MDKKQKHKRNKARQYVLNVVVEFIMNDFPLHMLTGSDEGQEKDRLEKALRALDCPRAADKLAKMPPAGR